MPTLEAFIERLRTPRPLLEQFGDTLLTDIRVGFITETDPNGQPWRPLSPATLAKKRGVGILRESGALFDSIDIAFDGENTVSVGPTGQLEYEAIHQFGGRSGRSLLTEIPQRAYIGLSNVALDQLREDMLSYWFGD